jgi:hypothetical protein
MLRDLIRENPLEAALAAFAGGCAEQSAPRLKSLLMKGGMELMKQAESHPQDAPDPQTTVEPDANEDSPGE